MDSINRQHIPEHSVTVEKLPSRSKAYPKNCELSYLRYSFGEIVKTNSSKLKTRGALELIISGIKSSFNLNDLTLSDTLYLGLMRKISTLGTEKIILPYLCKGCSNLNEYIFKNNELEFHELNVPDLPLNLELKSTGKTYKLMPLTLGKYLWLADKNKLDDELALRVCLCVNLPFDEVYYDWDNCRDLDDMAALKEAEIILDHGIKIIKVKCEKKLQNGDDCKYATSLRMEGKQQLLLPFRESGKSSECRISYGETPEHKPNTSGSNGLPTSETTQG